MAFIMWKARTIKILITTEDLKISMSRIGQNYDYWKNDYWKTTTNYTQGKTTVKEAIPKTAEQPVNISISDEGRNALREMASKFEPEPDDINARELTVQTNEVAWEHYAAMRDVSSLTLKDGNYNVEDVMKSIMGTYETRYNEIVKEHENGDREVSYGLTGKRSLTLEEDLAGLDEAFQMRLANLSGYITCQQTNKAFENPDSSWFFNRNGFQSEGKGQNKAEYLDAQYRDTAVSIMDQAKEKFLTAFKSMGYKNGAAISVLSDIMKENTYFVVNTQKLFS